MTTMFLSLQLFYSFFKSLVGKEVIVELKNDLWYVCNLHQTVFTIGVFSMVGVTLEHNMHAQKFSAVGFFSSFLEATTKTENQMESRLLLDVVVAQSASIFKLLSSKDESLLVWWNSFLVLNLGLDVLDCITSLNLEGDCLSSQCLYKNLHTTSQTKYQVKCRFLLNVVV